MKISTRVIAATAFLGLAGCASIKPVEQHDENAIISSYTKAYNDRDITAMSALMHSDIQWLSVEGDQITVVADGKVDLVAQMTDYVASPTATTSTLDGSIADGPFFAVREIASWPGADGSTAEQSALAIYEVSDGLILRVWYYPATQ
ncbi:MAG: nuclear transport factor 2 family protein [Pseudomonadota bacterium]